MELANIMLDIGSDGTTILAKSRVTPAEVAVLMRLHGNDAVSDVEVLEDEALNEDGGKRTHRQEIARLMEVYGKNTPEGGREAPAVSALFPGAAARVFETFEELELDEGMFKAETRSNAKPSKAKKPQLDHDGDGEAGGAAPSIEPGLAGLTITQLKTLADEQNVDLEGATKKADIIAKIEAAQAAQDAPADDVDEDDGIDDMDDRQTGSVFE